jgi:antitoxin (DNA-binding transcriptional repressor) of toxin-antitoxin stability system
VQAKRQSIVITKRGKPVAKLVPVDDRPDDIYGFLAGKGKAVGNVIAPAIAPKRWGNLKDLAD